MLACRNGETALVELLLSNKATNVDLSDKVRQLCVYILTLLLCLLNIVGRLYRPALRMYAETRVYREATC